MADDPQPDEGQGGTGDTGLYDSYLQFVPEDRRNDALAALKESSSTVDARLREAAELRKTYEPYTQIQGLTDYGPEGVGQLLGWHQTVTASEDAYREFLKTESQAAGLIPEEDRTPEQDALADLSPKQIEEQVQKLIAPLEERINNDQQGRLIEQETQLLNDRFTAFEKEHSLTLSPQQRSWIMAAAQAEDNDEGHMLALGHDWVTPGFDAYLQIRADAQKEFVDGKAKQPAPAVTAGGVAATHVSTSWEDVREQARERMRQSRT